MSRHRRPHPSTRARRAQVLYRLRFWWYGLRIFCREAWLWLRWQFEAAYRATCAGLARKASGHRRDAWLF